VLVPAARQLRVPRVVKFGSDFSGCDAGAVAMKRMAVSHEVVFCSDTDKICRDVLCNADPPPKKVYHDILLRKKAEYNYVDVYVTTPPCQDLSQNGSGAGPDGPKRTGKLIAKSLDYIKAKLPRLVILENVPTLSYKKYSKLRGGIIKFLEAQNYKVFKSILNSAKYGIPQERKRFFMVAIRRDSYKYSFKWPKINAKVPSVATILDKELPTDKAGRLPATARGAELCKRAYKKAVDVGVDPRTTTVCVDVDASDKFWTYGVNVLRTLTRSRGGAGGPWLSTRGRRMTTTELLRAQGFTVVDVPFEELRLSRRMVGQMMGNAVTVNTIGMILQEALWSAGLVSEKKMFPQQGHCS